LITTFFWRFFFLTLLCNQRKIFSMSKSKTGLTFTKWEVDHPVFINWWMFYLAFWMSRSFFYSFFTSISYPCKAEATIWLTEEVHRTTSSHLHLAKLWLFDPMHHAFVYSIFPQLWTITWKAWPFSFHWPGADCV
jgi:hypothetical protein